MKMETGFIFFILYLIAVICYIIYDELPSKYTKLEENFGVFINKSLVRFEFEKSPLHTIVIVLLVRVKLIFLDNF